MKLVPWALSVLQRFEMGMVDKFSGWSQSPHWSFFWMIYFFAWTAFRQLLHPIWYTPEIDLLVITWSSAIIPMWVADSMKVAQGIQMKKQAEQDALFEKQQELLIKIASLNMEVGHKILASVKTIEENTDEAETPPSST